MKINRRKIILASMAAPLTVKAQFIEAFVLGSFLSGALQGVMSYFTEKVRIEANSRLALANFTAEVQTRLVADTSVNYEVAIDSVRRYAITLGLVQDDGTGTLAGLKNGQFALFRKAETGEYIGGRLNPGEVENLPAIYREHGAFAVPTEAWLQNISRRESTAIKDRLEKKGYDPQYAALLATRRFSTQQQRITGPNVEMVSFSDTREPRKNGLIPLKTVWV